MRRILFTLLGITFLYLIYGLSISLHQVEILPRQLERKHPAEFYDYAGVVNVHSELSTGTGQIEDILRDAEKADLDFIFITDLNDFKQPDRNLYYHNKILVFHDLELSFNSSRLLNLDLSKDRQISGLGRSQTYVSQLLETRARERDEGIFILAHPFKPGYEWTDPFPKGIDGIEIINLKSIWQKAWLYDTASFLWTILVYPFNQELAFIRLFGLPQKEVDLWDHLNQEQPTIAIAGSDAESKFKLGFNNMVQMPSYSVLFNVVKNHLLLKTELTGKAEIDKKLISSGLRNGQFYMSLDVLADPKGFSTYVETRNGQRHPIGSRLQYQAGQTLKVHLPSKPKVPFDIIFLRNGEKIMLANSQDTELKISGPGAYRVIVRVIPTFPLPDGKKWVPWIFTNHFYIY